VKEPLKSTPTQRQGIAKKDTIVGGRKDTTKQAKKTGECSKKVPVPNTPVLTLDVIHSCFSFKANGLFLISCSMQF
jgi:hypothetical protein